eukprot:829621_1
MVSMVGAHVDLVTKTDRTPTCGTETENQEWITANRGWMMAPAGRTQDLAEVYRAVQEKEVAPQLLHSNCFGPSPLEEVLPLIIWYDMHHDSLNFKIKLFLR